MSLTFTRERLGTLMNPKYQKLEMFMYALNSSLIIFISIAMHLSNLHMLNILSVFNLDFFSYLMAILPKRTKFLKNLTKFLIFAIHVLGGHTQERYWWPTSTAYCLLFYLPKMTSYSKSWTLSWFSLVLFCYK